MSSFKRALVADGLMSVTDAAKWLGVHRTTVWNMMQRGELAFTYAPGRGALARRIPRKALVDWAAERLVGGAAND